MVSQPMPGSRWLLGAFIGLSIDKPCIFLILGRQGNPARRKRWTGKADKPLGPPPFKPTRQGNPAGRNRWTGKADKLLDPPPFKPNDVV